MTGAVFVWRKIRAMRTFVESSRRARVLALTAAALILSLLGGAMVLLFSGQPAAPPAALKPLPPPEAPPSSVPVQPDSSDALSAFGFGGIDGSEAGVGADSTALLGQGGLPSAGSAAALPAAQLPVLPAAQLPALPELPPLPAVQLPQFPAAPTIDWQAALAPYIQSQMNSTAANLAGSITGTAVGAGSGALNAAALAVGDLILYAAYSNNGGAMLSQLDGAASVLQAGASALPPPDLSGLSTAFAAAAAQPPFGMPAPPPALPDLPTPEEIAAALAVPAVGLPALPPINLPPPGPINLPPINLPPPPLIGLPSIGLPSLTRLFGLPF